ncbi:uncharacterized protein LOC121370423 isoform X2 [Gigantopelta aegis]|uniref:uncharacterized protein LOC121370423 isoform X2 n=1 Tax=Gigantopelta aegis TaxID=1735272 RepID=UPI001B88BEFB|nr:uncharacterized protein LOC121370423 isoform X2 [Gigantopelta aegis]
MYLNAWFFTCLFYVLLGKCRMPTPVFRGSVRLDQLEAAYFKQHGYTNHSCENKPCVFKGDYSLQATQENTGDNNTSMDSQTEKEKMNCEMQDSSVDGNQTHGTPLKGDKLSLEPQRNSTVASSTGVSSVSLLRQNSTKAFQITFSLL